MNTRTPPWEPPLAGSESEHLVAMLDRLRYTFRWKADGLTIEQLRHRLAPSTLSIGVLLKHLMFCEDDIFAWRIAGQRPDSMPDGDVDLDQWQFNLSDEDTAESLYAGYDAAVARSRSRLAEIVAEGRLDEPANLAFGEETVHIRRFVCDLVEEYGRHTGHADLIRESIDGRVGEDPPDDWRPGF